MNPFKKIIQTSCSILPTGILTKLSGIPVVLPYHHVVSDEHLPHIKEIYSYKNRKDFINDLDWLLKRFKPIHPDELAEIILNQKPLHKRSFLLSFDDGFREVNDVIAPILNEKGIPALFFISSAFIDNKELFYRCKLSLVLHKIKPDQQLTEKIAKHIGCKYSDYPEVRKVILKINYTNRHEADELGEIVKIDFEDFLKNQQPFLTSEQIKKLQKKGFVFGGHSIDHPKYEFLNINEQCNQTLVSTKFICQFGQNRFAYFAFPHEDREVKQEFFTQMNETGFPHLFFGLQNQQTEKQNHVLHRFNAEKPGEKISGVIKTVMMYNSLLRILNRQNIVRKSFSEEEKIP
jgi:peptidoglycan/xylan/chitin deacetylase (PgdA/CDA1 family)